MRDAESAPSADSYSASGLLSVVPALRSVSCVVANCAVEVGDVRTVVLERVCVGERVGGETEDGEGARIGGGVWLTVGVVCVAGGCEILEAEEEEAIRG